MHQHQTLASHPKDNKCVVGKYSRGYEKSFLCSVLARRQEANIEKAVRGEMWEGVWEIGTGLLFIHVGVSGMATTVTLEKCGHNQGYKGLDNRCYCPDNHCCVQGGPDCLESVIDMDVVCNKITDPQLDVVISVSQDAG
eukprot:g34540.t1